MWVAHDGLFAGIAAIITTSIQQIEAEFCHSHAPVWDIIGTGCTNLILTAKVNSCLCAIDHCFISDL
jgi:hypothetical protein